LNSDLLQLTSSQKALTRKQIENTYTYVEEMISNLGDKALNELIQGYGGDLDSLLNEILKQTSNIINFNSSTLNSEKLEYLDFLERSLDDSLKTQCYNYFKSTCLSNFTQNIRNIEWGNLIQLYNNSAYLCQRGSGKSYEFCYAFPMWRLWSYKRPHPLIQDTKDNKLRKETCLITNESRLGNIHIAKIVEEITINDILGERINPTGKANLGKEGITTEQGSILHKRSAGGFIRGLHVGASITDDFLDKSNLYSLEQRNKFKEVFKAEIKNIVDQGGYDIVAGTPFHTDDLYGDLIKDPNFHVFTYPGIMPNMELLAPDRFTFDFLMELKQSLGTIVFSREILVSPISDASSLFPWEYLKRAFIGMENISYVDNIDSFPIKLERVVVGADFAISGVIGADYTVYTVWGRDKDKNIYLLHVWRKQGASHDEQISQIISLDNRFKPNKIICESNGFQSILSSMAKSRGLKNIEEFTTTANIKKDLYSGLPSLSAMFERGQLKIPYKSDEDTQNLTNWLCGEFNSVTFNSDSGRLESADQHDDGVMSSFFAINELRDKDKILEMFLI
jgi:phage terminase large subunit-like protein